MAAVLELLLQERVTVDEVLRWVTDTTQESPVNPSLASLYLLRKDFAPFLLNFLREQTSQILSNGPSTPAKTPNSKTGAKTINTGTQRTIPEKRSTNLSGQRGSRTQLFPPTSTCSDASNVSVPSSNSISSDSSLMSRSNFTTFFKNSPNSSCSPYHGEKRSAQKSNLGNFMVFTPEIQTPRRGRKKSHSSRNVSKDLSLRSTEDEFQGENTPWSANRRKQVLNTSSSPVTQQINLNNLEEFPPMSKSCDSLSKSKPSRRINPTPISDVHSKSGLCFTSTPIAPSSLGHNHSAKDVFTSVQEGAHTPSTGSLREEREILRKEITKLQQHAYSPVVLDPVTPTKQSYSRNTSVSSDIMTVADPDKVSGRKQLGVLAELYSAFITENLVPNIFLELFFVLQLLTSRAPVSTEDRDCDLENSILIKDAVERQHFQSVHNCVFFAVSVLDFQFTMFTDNCVTQQRAMPICSASPLSFQTLGFIHEAVKRLEKMINGEIAHCNQSALKEGLINVISLLDKSTLKLLAENERILAFSPTLQERLLEAHRNSTGKVSLLLPSVLHSVSFQPETDNRSNFPSDRSFHIFKKQRDIFYELLREFEDCHEKADWDFERCLGNKIRAMMFNLSVASNHSHFARLFQKQLVQMCKGPSGGMGGAGENPDQDVLNMIGSENLNRLKQLQERFVTPQSVGGPCPPPSFPGFQEFFRDFILSAGNYQFNHHLMDSLCQEIQELDAISIEMRETADGVSYMGEQDEKIHFASILLTVRLLAKFLGFVTFLPYRTTETLCSELQESAVALRNQTLPTLDVLLLIRRSIQDHRTVLTVPWAVEYLSLVDCVAPYLDYYRKVFCLLLYLYRYKLILTEEKEMGFLNKLLLLSVLGWLFQVPTVPEDMFFNSEAAPDELSSSTMVATQALDCVPLVDQQLIYSCCPYIGELRKLLISFMAGCGAKNGGFIRKITPTAAEPLMPKPTLSQKKLQAELEQAFFHNQPPSLRRTVEFVAERIGSNCVKHIKATLVADLVKRAEVVLQDKVTEDSAGHSKLLDGVCVTLCEDGRQAVQKAQEYCKKKAPEAVRVLLPEEISACVLSSAEDIAVSLAIEKASTWLNTNISALIRREVKSTFTRMVKSQTMMSSVNCEEVKKGCKEDCEHKVMLPSRLITEIKDILCIAVGPREEEEGVGIIQLKCFLEHLSETLNCRKYITPSAELHLAKCTVELASLLVSDRVPLLEVTSAEADTIPELQVSKPEQIKRLLTSLLAVWKKDFRVPVPVQLMFTHKNIAYFTDVQAHEWDLFVFMLRRLIEMGLTRREEIEEHMSHFQEYKWTANLLVELDGLALRSENLREPDDLKDDSCNLVLQTVTEIIAPS